MLAGCRTNQCSSVSLRVLLSSSQLEWAWPGGELFNLKVTVLNLRLVEDTAAALEGNAEAGLEMPWSQW